MSSERIIVAESNIHRVPGVTVTLDADDLSLPQLGPAVGLESGATEPLASES